MSEFPEGFMPVPPEVQEMYYNHIERQKMSYEDTVHELDSFVESLDATQLEQFDAFLKLVAPSATKTAFWRGRIAGLRKSRDDVCLCGGKHSLNDLLEAPAPPEEKPELVVQTEFATDSATMVSAMLDYNLTVEDDKIVCKGCGKSYVSVEDRMLRRKGVEGCEGCIHKNKWG